VVAASVPGKIFYEWRVDLSRLSNGRTHLRPGQSLGFDVSVEDVDADSVLEVVVIATYITGFGRQGAVPFFSNAVLDWVGGEYIHRPDIERDIENLETAAAVRRVLRARRR